MFYRYERDGMGIFQWIKINDHNNWEYYRDLCNYWLNVHPEYKPSYRSYFTEKGDKRFPKVIQDLATEIIITNRLDNVVYADEYQVICEVKK